MNVLEKILEEIRDSAKIGSMQGEMVRIDMVEEIFHSHMDHSGDDTEMGDWIPVEERLPEEIENRYYPSMYVTTLNGDVEWGFYRVRDKQWYLYNEDMEEFESVENNKIVAWKDTPKAYKPKHLQEDSKHD